MFKNLKQQVAGIHDQRRSAGLKIAARKMRSHVSEHELVYGVTVVVLVTLLAVALAVQGWRSRIPTFDMLTYIRSVHKFLETGALTHYGDSNSGGAFSPPGSAWLILPSTLLFADPRLSDFVGAGLLHLVGLLGLFLLTRKYFGTWCASLAVVLYGLSATGLFEAGSLWPIGRPEFLIWMVYLASEWVTRRRARYLGASIAVWGIGMYVDMTILPAFFILPALWLVYRPPVRLKPLLAATAIVFLVWFPYLRFEAPRAFVDLRAQVLFHAVLPADYKEAWCDPGLRLRTLSSTPSALASSAGGAGVVQDSQSVFSRAGNYASDRFVSNFRGVALFPGNGAFSVALLVMVLVSLLWLSASPSARPNRPPWWLRWRAPLAVAAILSGLAAYVISRRAGGDPQLHLSDLHGPGKLLIAAGIALLAGTYLAGFAHRLFIRTGVRVEPGERAHRMKLVVLSLVIPWVILVAAAEAGKSERYLWIWPLQVMFLAAFAAYLLPRLGAPRPVIWLAQAGLVFLLVGNHLLTSRIDAWKETGWSGRNADEVRVVDYVANQLNSKGKKRAAIGYHIFIYPFMANFNIENPGYKAGADFDVLFNYRRHIVNTDTCAEGLSPKDEFRIVRTTPMTGPQAPRSYFDVPPDGRFRLVRRFGPYEVMRRA